MASTLDCFNLWIITVVGSWLDCCNKIRTVGWLKVKNSQKKPDLCEGFKNWTVWCGQASNTSDLLLQKQTKIIPQKSSSLCKFKSAIDLCCYPKFPQSVRLSRLSEIPLCLHLRISSVCHPNLSACCLSLTSEIAAVWPPKFDSVRPPKFPQSSQKFFTFQNEFW